MTLCTLPSMGCRPQMRERRPGRPPSGKRLAILARDSNIPAKVRSAFRRSLDPCDNSNDSGLGFDHQADPHHHLITTPTATTATTTTSILPQWNNIDKNGIKRPRMDVKVENDEINDGYSFPENIRNCKENMSLIRTAPTSSIPSLNINNNQTATSGRVVPRCIPVTNRSGSSAPVSLTTQLNSTSRYMDVSLTIVKQPEQQHRARYQTEGSRGAVKDRDGNGFPVVQLSGYYQPTTLQVFIGTDVGKVTPHMFYQACKVSGKNSTPCIEKKVDGTCVIELQLDPSKDMSATCDCVGILKERNVDVEHRFPDQLGNRSKKKSTRCRMIFRTTLTHDDGTIETLQVCSQPIVCTQPPGIPEISKKSLTSCPASGGLELFVLGKNFLKDTKVYFQLIDDDRRICWEQAVVPDKEYLQQTHFVCVVPPYRRPDITEPVTVRLCVVSSGKTSESHQFVYTPVNGAIPSGHVDVTSSSTTPSSNAIITSTTINNLTQQLTQPQSSVTQSQFFNKILWSSTINKREQDLDMMPPPETNLVPLATRRPSLSLATTSNEIHSPPLGSMKQEFIDENSQSSLIEPVEHERFRHISESSLDVHHGDSNISMLNENSIDIMSHNSNMSHMSNENSVDIVNRDGQQICDEQLSPTTNAVSLNRDDLKVMDLRMKMPIGTVADLASSNAPSMATLQSFGVTEHSSLPAQTAQSVENYLTNIETKPSIPSLTNEQSTFQQKLLSPPVVIHNHLLTPIIADTQPVYMSQRNLLPNTTQNEVAMHIVAKSEAAAIGEQTTSSLLSPIITTTATTTATPQSTTNLETTIINTTEKLDDLVNSTVESHMGNTTTASTTSQQQQNNVLLTTRDVMLTSRTNLLVPPIINTTITSPTHNISSDIILNSQISPSLMCRNTTQNLNSICQATTTTTTTATVVDEPILQQTLLTTPVVTTSPPTTTNHLITTDPEKVVILKAAVDFLETQKKLSEFDNNPLQTTTTTVTTTSSVVAAAAAAAAAATTVMDELMNVAGQLQNTTYQQTPQTLLQQQQQQQQQQSSSSTSISISCSSTTTPIKTETPTTLLTVDNNKADFVIPVPVKEMTQENKNEDRMIPQSFTSLTENELINLINPSCFDQV